MSIELSGVRVEDGLTDVTIVVDVGAVVHEVDWESIDPGATSVAIDEDWPAIGEVREHVVEAFQGETE